MTQHYTIYKKMNKIYFAQSIPRWNNNVEYKGNSFEENYRFISYLFILANTISVTHIMHFEIKLTF